MSRRRNTATRNLTTEPRVGSKLEENKEFHLSDNLEREKLWLESYRLTSKKRPIEDQTREGLARRPQLLTVGAVYQYRNTVKILGLTLPSFLDSRLDHIFPSR